MQGKSQIIERIIRLNPTADWDWLEEFEMPALERYLDHLHHAIEPRGRESYWFRNHETSAVVSRRPAA